ncbi:MAG: LptF/LptG family permease [Phycisphaerales bacterium]|nr:LptF/LptG family permease [Phycisphaerales bacterium]
MLWTLQTYIFREMGKTFLLTSIGLIAVIGLGGGVMNMIELEGVGALQLLKIIGLIIPVAATLTLPIAALYAATVTYGRLSADNELVACRSGGINIHVLFLPTVVISLVSAVCSFVFINFVIPSMIRNLDRFVSDDLPRIIKQQLSSSDRFSLRDKYVIYSDSTELVTTEDGQPILRLNGVAFSEMDDNAWRQFGTARTVHIAFGHYDGMPTLAADMYNINVYDAARGGFFSQAHQPILESTIPRRVPVKIKWLTLGGLLEYRAAPETFPDVQEQLTRLRGGIARAEFFAQLKDSFSKTGEVHFGDAETTMSIRSKKLATDVKDGRPRFLEDVLIIERHADGLVRTIRSAAAAVDVRQGTRLDELEIDVQANENVSIQDPRAGDSATRRDREKFEPILLDPRIIHAAEGFPAEKILDASTSSLGFGEWVHDHRMKLIGHVQGISREITGELHTRIAFSVSVFALVILGAALGIVFRGSQVLVAFGISFVPSLLVISMIIMGKQLIEKPGMTMIGVGVVWLGIAIVVLVDLFVMTKVVRR